MEIRIELTGTLAVVAVEDGMVVEKGERLGEVECMKAFFGIDAPCSGKITWRINLGEVVGPDDVIAVISPEG